MAYTGIGSFLNGMPEGKPVKIKQAKCKCSRVASKTFNGHRWCCIQCARDGSHTVWCNRRNEK